MNNQRHGQVSLSLPLGRACKRALCTLLAACVLTACNICALSVPTSTATLTLRSLGCWQDKPAPHRAVSSLEQAGHALLLLNGTHINYQHRDNALRRCALTALRLGYDVFVLQNGGWCGAAADAGSTYRIYGRAYRSGGASASVVGAAERHASRCSDGLGGPFANDVYAVVGMSGGVMGYEGTVGVEDAVLRVLPEVAGGGLPRIEPGTQVPMGAAGRGTAPSGVAQAAVRTAGDHDGDDADDVVTLPLSVDGVPRPLRLAPADDAWLAAAQWAVRSNASLHDLPAVVRAVEAERRNSERWRRQGLIGELLVRARLLWSPGPGRGSLLVNASAPVRTGGTVADGTPLRSTVGGRGRMLFQTDAHAAILCGRSRACRNSARDLIDHLAEGIAVAYRTASIAEAVEIAEAGSAAEDSSVRAQHRRLPGAVRRALGAPLEAALSAFGRQQHSLRESLRRCPLRTPSGSAAVAAADAAPAQPNADSEACPSRWAVLTLTNYSVFADDNVRALLDGLRDLGFDAVLEENGVCMADVGVGGCASRQHIVPGVLAEVWLMAAPPVLSRGALLYQLEQLDADRIRGATAASSAVRQLLERHTLLEYSYANVEHLRALGYPCTFLLPTGRSSAQHRADAAGHVPRNASAEAVQLGGGFERRHDAIAAMRRRGVAAEVLDGVWGAARRQRLRAASVGLNVHGHRQHIAEITRLLHYGSSGLAVVSEDGTDAWLERELPGMVFVRRGGGGSGNRNDWSSMERAVVALLGSGDANANTALARLRARARALAQLREQWLLLVQTVVAIFPGCAQRLAKQLRDTLLPSLRERLLHLQDSVVDP